MTIPTSKTDSPCVKVCLVVTMSDGKPRCTGCYRTLPEIASWHQMGEKEKEVITASLQFRKLALEAIDTNYR